jgi:predicted AlkP superfamily pyrophosphatase or phosphodiesterase
MSQKLIVFSADAMVHEDVDYLKTLPNYRRYLAGGAEVKKIKTVYPSLTYPAHVSMVTGNYPDRHGVVSNSEFIPGSPKLVWNWFHKVVHCTDLFDVAKKKGLTTAAVYWPVTGGHPSIDHLIAAYWTQIPGETIMDAQRRAGASDSMIKIIEKYKDGWIEKQSPGFDIFKINCASELIRQYKPDLLMVHPTNIDNYRHHNGVFNNKVTQGVKETDEWIGQIMGAVEKTGALDETNFFLVSDHGQIDTKRIININVLLADHGLITTDEKGGFADWDAYCCSGGMSALVYLKNPDDEELRRKTGDLLRSLCDEGIYGIGRVFTEEEARAEEHLGGGFAFVIESDGYTAFADNWVRPLVKNFDLFDYRYGRATHGYLPNKGPQPILLAKGPAIQEGVVLEQGNIIDEAPTYAHILGLTLPDAEGVSISGILKGHNA